MLSGDEIIEKIINPGYLKNCEVDNVQSSSIDVRLGYDFKIPDYKNMRGKHTISNYEIEKKDWLSYSTKITLSPGEFCLASTFEEFHLPDNISATFSLRSSVARCGINHCLAGHIDAGFSGNITLELSNYHPVLLDNAENYLDIRLSHMDRIGQIIFYEHSPCSIKYSYSHKGRYLESVGTVTGKGV